MVSVSYLLTRYNAIVYVLASWRYMGLHSIDLCICGFAILLLYVCAYLHFCI